MSIPFANRISDAFLHSCSLAPKFKIATFLPSFTILPFPISNISINTLVIQHNTPFPLGYLNAEGLSLIFTDVLIIFTNSDSSLAAITTKFGKVDK